MAAELPRPGVEVIQQFAAPSASFVRPTLVPCVVGPAFEVINVLNTDGTLNSKALYGTYTQQALGITESGFPDPRNNIDELDILEETVAPYMLAGGVLNQLKMNPGAGFLATAHGAGKAAMVSDVFGGVGLAIQGLTIVLAIDQPVRLDTSSDIVVTFTGSSALSASQAAAQINTAAGMSIASVIGTGSSQKVVIASPIFGALSSVTVRAGGSANTLLKLGYVSASPAHEERVEGSGWRGQDDNNNNTTTPWIEFYQGAYFVDGVDTSFPSGRAGLYNIEDQTTLISSKQTAVTFGSAPGQLPLEVGDFVIADGVRVKNGEVAKVEAARFKIGTINTALSTADANGNYTSKVYDIQEVGTLFDPSPFAPQYVYAIANNLDWSLVAPVAASATGSVSAASPIAGSVTGGVPAVTLAPAGLTLHYVSVQSGVATEGVFTFTGGPFVSMAALASAIGTSIPGVTPSDSAGNLKFTTTGLGRLNSITIKKDGTANTMLGFSTSSDTTGVGTDAEIAGLTGTSLQFTLDKNPHIYTVVFTTDSLDICVDEINAVAKATVASKTNGGLSLKMTAPLKGMASDVSFPGPQSISGTVTMTNGSTAVTGSSTKFTTELAVGQYIVLDADGLSSLARVDSITSDTALTLSANYGGTGGSSAASVVVNGAEVLFGMVVPTTVTGSGRPYPDAYMDDALVLNVNAEILRDQVSGYPLDQLYNSGSLYIQFKALRKDVTAVAQVAGVLRLSDTTTLSTVLDPITEENPLALGLFMAMINAPTFEVKGLGVDAVTPAAPEGTQDAWARAAGLLESEEIYAIAPLTQDEVVIQLWGTHVDVMAQPEQGGERIVFVNKVMPTRKNSKVALTGASANSTATTNQVVLDAAGTAGLVQAGITNPASIPETAGVYLELTVAGEVRRYNVSSVSGALVNLRTTFASTSTNSDGFYSETVLNVSVVNAAYGLKVRGASLSVPGSNPARLDYQLVAETVAEANATYKNRRLYSTFPDTIKTTVQGSEKSLPGYYACAALAGMCGAQPPQQGFTNFPITGLTGVVGTEKFTKRQLNVMAAGGTFILLQNTIGAPVTPRHQLSTDLTSIETRELSITKVVDFVAKFLRTSVRKFIGTSVIDKNLLDTLGSTVHAALKFLEEVGVLNGSNINQLVQDSANPDTVLIDITLDVPYPCNYIRITLVV